jgi:hypothetical protein
MTLIAKLALLRLRMRYRRIKDSRVRRCDIGSIRDARHTIIGIIDQVFAAFFFIGLTTRFFSSDSCDAHHSEWHEQAAGWGR